MKRKSIIEILFVFGLFVSSCNEITSNSDYPSTPEGVVKAAVSCLRDSDWSGYANFIQPRARNESLSTKLPDIIKDGLSYEKVEILDIKYENGNTMGEYHASVSTKIIMKDGKSKKQILHLYKQDSKWYLSYKEL